MIRHATDGDELALKMLSAAGAEERPDAPFPFNPSWDDVLARVPEGVLVSLDERGAVCGFVAFSVVGEVYSGLQVSVGKDVRGRGIGLELLRAAHECAKKRGAKHAATLLWKPSGLMPFYEKVGYKATGYVMTKEF